MRIPYPICLDCIHLNFKNKVNGRPTCKAFPAGVPDKVFEKKCKHNVNKNEICGNGYKFEDKNNG